MSPPAFFSPRLPPSRRLSQLDAFFVAYQEVAEISMQLGAEVELAGELPREHLAAAVAEVVRRFPHLGQRVSRRLFGLAWQGPVAPGEMLASAGAETTAEAWSRRPLDPFSEPSLQLLWRPGREGTTVALRAHHAALDGQSFHAIASLILTLAAGGGRAAVTATPAPARDPLRPGRLLARALRRGELGGMGRHLRWVVGQARSGNHARLALRGGEPGDTAICQRQVAGEAGRRLGERARALGVHPAWLCCAAWARTLAGWNRRQGQGSEAPISLEVPVSVRRGRPRPEGADGYFPGNAISPLILIADPAADLEPLARELAGQVRRGLRQRAHLAMPLATAPARYLPWPLLRRSAADTTFSGFATSHFTFLADRGNLAEEIARRSGGRLRLAGLSFSTPVCLHMGVALMVLTGHLAEPGALLLSLTHRLAALTPEDADELADHLLAELA